MKYFSALIVALSAVESSFAEMTTQEFKAGIENGDYDMVLDVRRQDEWDGGHIPGAIHVPLDTFSDDTFWEQMTANAETYSCNKECATIVVTCKVGGRAGTAIKQLEAMGFKGTLINGQGTTQWVDAGFELALEEMYVQPTCVGTDICPNAAISTDTASMEESSAATTSIVGLGALAIPSFLALL